MQQEPLTNSELPQSSHAPISSAPSQHGSFHPDHSGLYRVRSGSSSASARSVRDLGRRPGDGIDADQVDEQLLGLSLDGRSDTRSAAAGQRVSDYENALTPPTPRQALGFKVIKRINPDSNGPQLSDFPNEILTHILSHLHPDSHASVALVSKRFYSLVTTPHAWRMAFLRYFPGHTVLEPQVKRRNSGVWADVSPELVRSETRYFGRLTSLATWRSEYWFRTRLIRSLARGKPGTGSGGIGSSIRTSQTGRKASAVLTYNSKLPWLVTNIHAVFANGKKPPKAIHGGGDLGVATMSDPTSGKVEKWGLEDPFTSAQLEEVVPNLVPYGLGEGAAATPNVMDVSQPYGLLAGEGFPGGRAVFRGVNEMSSKYLGAETGVADTYPDIPKIPEMSEAICSVWLAKSSAVPTVTKSLVGMLTGSTLGVVTAYSLGSESGGSRYTNGDMTARWILSPGVPIISLKVDENYSFKRKSADRVWAVALNALGEVFYLTETPIDTITRAKGDDVAKNAWYTGRTVYWHLLESTRRVARPDELDKNAIRGAYSPRSPSNSMNLNKDQLAAEAREIEKFLRHKPAYFRKVCQGWDMQRRLEVDFAGDDAQGAGENIFVIDCGLAEGTAAHVERYSRSRSSGEPDVAEAAKPALSQPSPSQPASSLFGSIAAADAVRADTPKSQSSVSPPPVPVSSEGLTTSLHDWYRQTMNLKGQAQCVISASTLDHSTYSVLTLAEDPLVGVGDISPAAPPHLADTAVAQIPGRRARLLAIGTKSGAVVAWNAREEDRSAAANPVRTIQTDSPEISCLAATALYLVHGGSDGLVQAWEPLASTEDPIRTLNSRSNGRVPRHMTTMNPTLREGSYSAVGAIYLDPDPTVLRGVLSFGAFLRYWAYSSKGHPTGRKRRHRHTDVHGRVASRRLGGAVSGYIAAEEAELRRENEQRAREQARLRNRFGVGALGDLTEQEAIEYAQMISEEAFQVDEQRRASDSAADAGLDTASSYSELSTDTITPEPSVAGLSPPPVSVANDDEEAYEQQVQQAIRLSLLEGVNDLGQSPRGHSSGDYEFAIKYKAKGSKKNKSSRSSSPYSDHTPGGNFLAGPSKSPVVQDDDEDLAIALSLSLQDQELASSSRQDPGEPHDEFPPLNTKGVGKGKGVSRW
ncbi:hypothetical protein S7711_00792 [Stachybotrys chartarum IBT 7711]|uniref:F-box domain-containing protein n=1 Tax=Stachybotrys chartarum (strain CBS 109288 / IBT 7711) TaxID=1280523 RepID=A0A084B074_STACB|nr:hypothetical protein S7711_00792 [Stachybotrys chartarum IBT 7711]